eukprot:scaffold4750_cov212-Pinguiococcus_pyrenoidosus.AAC.3
MHHRHWAALAALSLRDISLHSKDGGVLQHARNARERGRSAFAVAAASKCFHKCATTNKSRRHCRTDGLEHKDLPFRIQNMCNLS